MIECWIKKLYWKSVPFSKRKAIQTAVHEFKYGAKVRKELHNLCSGEYNQAEYIELEKYLTENKISVFNYEFVKKYRYFDYYEKIEYDDVVKMYFCYRNNRRMYISRKYSSREMVASYLCGLDMEQDDLSPHKYTTLEDDSVEFDVLVDVGAAEGFFSLDHIDDYNKIYIVEGDVMWIEALKLTFRHDTNKVIIINKFASNVESKKFVRLDGLCADFESIAIKMDVEGMEKQVLEGARCIIRNTPKLKMYIAAYHKHNSINEIMPYIENMKTEFSRGFMINLWEHNMKSPYFRRGIIRAYRME